MKTIKEFDYDLWAIEENGKKKYFVRVKATGEESEVSHEVMKVLLASEKQMRRDLEKHISNQVLSLNCLDEISDNAESCWLIDKTQNVEEQVIMNDQISQFILSLTNKQREIYEKCMIGQCSIADFANKSDVSRQAVMKTVLQIREKAKKYFS